ncbi:MAG: hypothetical protein VXW26_17025, partial [SAR324 cluster bacterium]|nr:hypothetical protein [SAR324 cluster bacterium]
TLILPHQMHLGAENALFLRKKGAPLPKNLSKYLCFARQTHLGAENALFLPKKEPAYRRIYQITFILPNQTHLGTVAHGSQAVYTIPKLNN